MSGWSVCTPAQLRAAACSHKRINPPTTASNSQRPSSRHHHIIGWQGPVQTALGKMKASLVYGWAKTCTSYTPRVLDLTRRTYGWRKHGEAEVALSLAHHGAGTQFEDEAGEAAKQVMAHIQRAIAPCAGALDEISRCEVKWVNGTTRGDHALARANWKGQSGSHCGTEAPATPASSFRFLSPA